VISHYQWRDKYRGGFMKQITTLKKEIENKILTPVTLSGVIVPWITTLNDGRNSDYKLVCRSGVEYFIVADGEWKTVLSSYSWDDVKIRGLLNFLNMTLIPQKVFPKGPTGEKESAIDLTNWGRRDFAKKIMKSIGGFVLFPVAA
jgi:hypothetical protein